MYSEHIGDIFSTTAPAIGHGVNCKGVMGAGIAKVIKAKMPDKYFNRYAYQCDHSAMAGRATLWFDPSVEITVVNLFTQVEPGANAEYELLVASMSRLVKHPWRNFDKIALPRIGCGIGGLDWQVVKPILQGFSHVIDIEVWELPGVEW